MGMAVKMGGPRELFYEVDALGLLATLSDHLAWNHTSFFFFLSSDISTHHMLFERRISLCYFCGIGKIAKFM